MERRGKSSKITIAFFFIALLGVSLLFLAPLALPSNSARDLSGSSLLTDNEDIISTMSQPWKAIYSIGDVLCHQKAERSFALNGNQLPFCTRCMGIWLGFVIGLWFMVFYKIELDEKFIFAIVIGLVPIGVDGVGQLFGFWESTNILRMVTGLITGVVSGIALGIIIDELKTLKSFKNNKN